MITLKDLYAVAVSRSNGNTTPPMQLVYYSSEIVKGVPPWTRLHSYRWCDPVWLAEWELSIPGYGCQCRRDYALYKASTPPDFSSPEALWLWGFNLHNWVNRKLGKPELTVDEARLQWSRSDGEEITSEAMGGTAMQQVP